MIAFRFAVGHLVVVADNIGRHLDHASILAVVVRQIMYTQGDLPTTATPLVYQALR